MSLDLTKQKKDYVRSLSLGVGKRIKEIREQKQISKKTLWKAIAVTQSQYDRYENGLTAISTGALIAIADVLDVSLLALLPTGEIDDNLKNLIQSNLGVTERDIKKIQDLCLSVTYRLQETNKVMDSLK